MWEHWELTPKISKRLRKLAWSIYRLVQQYSSHSAFEILNRWNALFISFLSQPKHWHLLKMFLMVMDPPWTEVGIPFLTTFQHMEFVPKTPSLLQSLPIHSVIASWFFQVFLAKTLLLAHLVLKVAFHKQMVHQENYRCQVNWVYLAVLTFLHSWKKFSLKWISKLVTILGKNQLRIESSLDSQ